MNKTIKCPICNINKDCSVNFAGRKVCKSCLGKSYKTSAYLAETSGYSLKTIEDIRCKNRSGAPPAPDAYLNKAHCKAPLWLPETASKWADSRVSKIDGDYVLKATKALVTRPEMAKHLGVTLGQINFYCRKNKIKSVFAIRALEHKKTMDQDISKETQKLINQVFRGNKCRIS